MLSREYVLGALDSLIKCGEVSPEYAAGVADMYEKCAGLMGDTGFDQIASAANAWIAANPGKQMPPDVAKAIVQENKGNWYNFGMRGGIGVGAAIKNRFGRAFSWMPGSKMTASQYDDRYANAQNEGNFAIIKEYERQGKYLPPQMMAALQDAYSRDAKAVETGSKTYMTQEERNRAGFGDGSLVDKFRTESGEMAAASGAYKPTSFKSKLSTTPAPAPAPAYGNGLPTQYGANKDLFYKQDFSDPTET